MKAPFEDLLSDMEVAKEAGVTLATNRYHRRQGSRRTVSGTVTGIDGLGRVWIKIGGQVWYSKVASKERIDEIVRKAAGGVR
jgi:hypothetical protein